MQQMAKSANSKVIFLPAQNQTVQESMAQNLSAEGSSQIPMSHGSAEQEYGQHSKGFQSAINSSVIEHM
jgi:erythrocyte band 7 integral membrane protein